MDHVLTGCTARTALVRVLHFWKSIFNPILETHKFANHTRNDFIGIVKMPIPNSLKCHLPLFLSNPLVNQIIKAHLQNKRSMELFFDSESF